MPLWSSMEMALQWSRYLAHWQRVHNRDSGRLPVPVALESGTVTVAPRQVRECSHSVALRLPLPLAVSLPLRRSPDCWRSARRSGVGELASEDAGRCGLSLSQAAVARLSRLPQSTGPPGPGAIKIQV